MSQFGLGMFLWSALGENAGVARGLLWSGYCASKIRDRIK